MQRLQTHKCDLSQKCSLCRPLLSQPYCLLILFPSPLGRQERPSPSQAWSHLLRARSGPWHSERQPHTWYTLCSSWVFRTTSDQHTPSSATLTRQAGECGVQPQLKGRLRRGKLPAPAVAAPGLAESFQSLLFALSLFPYFSTSLSLHEYAFLFISSFVCLGLCLSPSPNSVGLAPSTSGVNLFPPPLRWPGSAVPAAAGPVSLICLCTFAGPAHSAQRPPVTASQDGENSHCSHPMPWK